MLSWYKGIDIEMASLSVTSVYFAAWARTVGGMAVSQSSYRCTCGFQSRSILNFDSFF